MAQLRVEGEVIKDGQPAGEWTGEGFEKVIPGEAKLILDTESAIASGDLTIAEITGGIIHDAETGEVSYEVAEPFIDPESSFGKAIAAFEAEVEATIDWLNERGSKAARSIRHRGKGRSEARSHARNQKIRSGLGLGVRSFAEIDGSAMEELIDAEAVIAGHSREFKSNQQATNSDRRAVRLGRGTFAFLPEAILD